MLVPSAIHALWEMELPQDRPPLCCSCAQGGGTDRGVCGQRRVWLQARVPTQSTRS